MVVNSREIACDHWDLFSNLGCKAIQDEGSPSALQVNIMDLVFDDCVRCALDDGISWYSVVTRSTEPTHVITEERRHDVAAMP